MSDLNLQELFLNLIVSYGEPMIAIVLLLGALGVPLPGTLMVIASGAFVRQGILNIFSTPLFGLLGAVSGDTIIYGLGRFANVWIKQRFGQTASWQKAHTFFEQRGGIAIYLTRWLLTPFAIPTNLIAGSSGYPFWKLLLFVISGEVTWILLYGGLGYAFGSQWELISDFISNFTGLIVGLFILGLGIYFAYRSRK